MYRKLENLTRNSRFTPGHFYSPIINVDDIKSRQNEIWGAVAVSSIVGIELNDNQQKNLMRELQVFYKDLPFQATKQEHLRYYYENEYYSYADSIILFLMLRYYRPKRIIEVGSGFSSAMMLDTNELFFNSDIDLTFIEPYPDRLKSLLNERDKSYCHILENNIQDVSLETFKKLEKGDILFIDSSHIVKTGSDVNFILFTILPILKSGVIIHFHDIFYPFEYPKEWVLNGWNWNESYVLRSFLMYNDKFSVLLFTNYLQIHHEEIFKSFPLLLKSAGQNLWLIKNE